MNKMMIIIRYAFLYHILLFFFVGCNINILNNNNSNLSNNNNVFVWAAETTTTDGGKNNNNVTIDNNTKKTEGKDGQEEEEEEEEEEVEANQYLYHDGNNSYPVIDYEPPPHLKKKNEKQASSIDDKPEFLYNGTNQGARVVEFYAHWCPHCQHFRTHYVQLARQVTAILKEMNQNNKRYGDDNNHNNNVTVQFYAISCTVNKKICHDFEIHGYPKIKLFRAGVTNTTLEAMYYKIHPFDILTSLNIKVDHLRLDEIVEEHDKKSDNEKLIKQQQQQVGAKKLRKNLKHNTDKNQNDDNNHNKNNIVWPKRTKKQVFDDAYKSFDFSLRNGIFTKAGPLSNETQAVFRTWLELLQKTMPVGWNIVHTPIRSILDKFDYAIQKEDNLLEILNNNNGNTSNHDYNPKPWSKACTRGISGMGYTCGLWQLFHIITVGVVEYNLMISSEDVDDGIVYETQLSTVYAAETIRNFVQHFFGCDVCRTNFLKSYDTCDHDRCNRLSADIFKLEQWIQLPVWLFETHNSVNVRLLHEAAERGEHHGIVTRQDEIDKHWPSKYDCPPCWTDNEAWDEQMIYKYLRLEYWPDDFTSTGYRAEIGTYTHSDTNNNPSTEDDDYEPSTSRVSLLRFVQFLIVGIIVALTLSAYLKTMEKKRSGRHKKVDY